MGKITLSHSKKEKYNGCPRRYDFHYNKKWRVKDLQVPLYFGSAIDEALNVLLLQKKKNLTKEEKELSEKNCFEVFKEEMTKTKHNKQDLFIPTHTEVSYPKNAFNLSLFTEQDFAELEMDKGEIDGYMDWYYEERKKKEPDFSKEDKGLFSRINWHSLVRVGQHIIKGYKEDVMPQLAEVKDIQVKIFLPDGEGNDIIGYIDFIASFIDDPDTFYIVDNKTSAAKYTQADLDESQQLHLYAYAQELEHIAYIVCEKTIRKRDPKHRIHIMRGKVDEEFTDLLLDSYQEVLENIKEEKFEPNYDSGCMFFHKRCEYYSICHQDKFDDDVLVDLGGKK